MTTCCLSFVHASPWVSEHHLPTQRRRARLQAEVRNGFRAGGPGAQEIFHSELDEMNAVTVRWNSSRCDE